MSCSAEVIWLKKYPNGIIEAISPRFNRPNIHQNTIIVVLLVVLVAEKD